MTSVEIPESARQARSVPQMSAAVEVLRSAETVQAMPYLARIDRKVTGWLTIIAVYALRMSLALGFFALAFVVALLSLRLVLQYGAALTMVIRSERTQLVWLLLLLVGGLLVARSKAIRRMLEQGDVWPDTQVPRPLYPVLRLADGLSKGLVVALVLCFALLWLLPSVLFILEASVRLPEWYQQRELLLGLVRPIWGAVLALVIVSIPLIYWISQRQNRNGLIQAVVFVLSIAGLATLFVVTPRDAGWLYYDGAFWNAPALPLPEPLFGYYVQFAAWAADPLAPLAVLPAPAIAFGLLILALIFPFGMAPGLASPLRWPFLLFRDALYWSWSRMRLRWAARRAIRDHARRNRGQVSGDPWATVCREHLLRFETKTVKRSYFRKLSYHFCPACGEDNQTYNGVECLTLLLDRSADVTPQMQGSALMISGILWLLDGGKQTPPVFDAIVIGQVQPLDIEEFILHYVQYTDGAPSAHHKPLARVTARIARDSNIELGQRRMLENHVAKTEAGFDLQEERDPCVKSVRQSFGREQRSRQIRRLAWRTAFLVIMLVVGWLLFARLPRLVDAVDEWRVEVWPTMQQVFEEQIAEERPPTRTPRPPATRPAVTPAPEESPTKEDVSAEAGASSNGSEPVTVAPVAEDGAELVFMPAGTFTMGSNAGSSLAGTEDEYPAHEVDLPSYYIDAYEVTNGQYEACVQAGECDPPQSTQSNRRGSYYGNDEFADYPVIKVTWQNAADYCAWAGRRLPTEAEWEKAARWSPDGRDRRYPWGNETPSVELLNFAYLVNDTSAVGAYPAGRSPSGAYDMAGNVWEWVSDWYDAGYYSQSPAEDPAGPETGLYKILRGGAWGNADYDVTVTQRFSANPLDSRFDGGFRCALDGTR